MERTYGMTDSSQLLRPLCLFLSKNRFLVCLVKQRMRKIVSRNVSSDRLKMSMIRLNRTNEWTNKWTNERTKEWKVNEKKWKNSNKWNEWLKWDDRRLAGWLAWWVSASMKEWVDEQAKIRLKDRWMNVTEDILRTCQRQFHDMLWLWLLCLSWSNSRLN